MTNQEVDVAISTRPEVALAWLEELYDNYVDFGSYVWVAKAYILHLLDNIIFVDKSLMHVHIYMLVVMNVK